jgi:Glycosyl transferase family 2
VGALHLGYDLIRADDRPFFRRGRSQRVDKPTTVEGDHVNRHAPNTVVMPVYNSEHTIDRAVGSIASQTYPDWELIAVDDSSTDGSRVMDRHVAGVVVVMDRL